MTVFEVIMVWWALSSTVMSLAFCLGLAARGVFRGMGFPRQLGFGVACNLAATIGWPILLYGYAQAWRREDVHLLIADLRRSKRPKKAA